MVEKRGTKVNVILFIFLISFLILGTNVRAFTGSLIVNHTAVMEFNQYQNDPAFQSYITLAKSMFNISYGHSSHGSQIEAGMNWMKNNIGGVFSTIF